MQTTPEKKQNISNLPILSVCSEYQYFGMQLTENCQSTQQGQMLKRMKKNNPIKISFSKDGIQKTDTHSQQFILSNYNNTFPKHRQELSTVRTIKSV